MIVIYEVNFFIERSIETAYRHWLAQHIDEILCLPGFVEAKCFEVQVDDSNCEFPLCVHYYLDSQTSLDDYLLNHAPRLRADGIARFGDRFRATRRVLCSHEAQ
jgi:Domain of unknown function (DUF4286)